MKRKLIFVGVVTLVVLAVIILIAGRHGWNQSTRNEHSQFVLTSDGKLTFKPGHEPKMTVVVNQRQTIATNAPIGTASPR